MENSLSVLGKRDMQTGLTIQAAHQSKSGFLCVSGLRTFGKLTIEELVASTNTISFLNGVRVYDQNKTLIAEHYFPQRTRYSREAVRKSVMLKMLHTLRDASLQQGLQYNELEAKGKISDMLNQAFYKESYEAVLDWASEVGIF